MNYIPKNISHSVSHSDELSKLYFFPARLMYQNKHAHGFEQIINRHCQQKVTLEPNGYVIIDFGTELCGGVMINTGNVVPLSADCNKVCRLRIRFGESVGEASSELGKNGSTNDHSPRDTVYDVGFYSKAEIGYTGFRFVRIDNIDDSHTLEISDLQAYAYFRDIEYKGSFKSSDEVLDKIFQTAAYTVHLCMQDYIWDGIKRDRLVWVGDMYPEVAAICSVFGHDDSVEKSLDFMRDTSGEFMNGIITYSAWWIICHYRWYMQNGNIDYLARQHSTIFSITHKLAEFITSDGAFDPKNCWALFDWPSNSDLELTKAGVHAIFKIMFDDAAFLLGELNDTAEKHFCEEASFKLSQYKYPDFDYKQVSAMRVFACLCDAKEENSRLLSKNNASGISTFLGMFTFDAMTRAGNARGAIECVKGLYGKMLSVGATSFWEDFDPAWCENAGRIDEFTPEGLDDLHGDRGAYCYRGYRHSLCHGWSAGVCAYMSEWLLGIKIKAPGCKEIEISPANSGLDFIEGAYPTPHGTIFVSHKRRIDGTFETKYTAPSEIRIVINHNQQ